MRLLSVWDRFKEEGEKQRPAANVGEENLNKHGCYCHVGFSGFRVKWRNHKETQSARTSAFWVFCLLVFFFSKFINHGNLIKAFPWQPFYLYIDLLGKEDILL